MLKREEMLKQSTTLSKKLRERANSVCRFIETCDYLIEKEKQKERVEFLIEQKENFKVELSSIFNQLKVVDLRIEVLGKIKNKRTSLVF